MSTGRVIVYGGKGALGSTCVSFFKKQNWWVGSIDISASEVADCNVLINLQQSWTEQNESVQSAVSSCTEGKPVDAILCVAGGWAGGNAKSEDFVKNADLMWKQSVWTSVIAAQMSAKYLRPGGLLVLTGAEAALGPTPGMIGYGMAKAAVHQLVKSLSANKGGLPENSVATAILPVTLDTPMNRKFMPKADQTTWTSLEFVAQMLFDWSSEKNRPENGSLNKLITKNSETEIINA